MDNELRHGLRVALYEWNRGIRTMEEVFDRIEELFRRGVSTQPAPTPDQIVPPSPSG